MPPRAQFNISLAGYEETSVTLDITPDQTAICHTNLVGVKYAGSMTAARRFLAGGDYDRAYLAAEAALTAKPADVDATAVKNEAPGEATSSRPKVWLAAAITSAGQRH